MEPLTTTIVVPCHNHARYLRSALDSALIQSRPAHEIIIVDDGSTDNTAAVAQDVIAENPGKTIPLIRKDAADGLSAARNSAIDAATGKYILPLDADDILHPHYLQRLGAILDADWKVDVVSADRFQFGILSTPICLAPDPELLPLANQYGYCSLYRKTVWVKTNGYRHNHPIMGYEDWEFWLTAHEKGCRFQHVPEVLWAHRMRADSMGTAAATNHDFLMARIVERHPDLYTPETLEQARQTLARGLLTD